MTSGAGADAEAGDWVQLDGFGQVISTFSGTVAELSAHATAGLPGATVTGPTPSGVYVRQSGTKVTTPLVTVRTPWSSQRWIPRPRSAARPDWTAWIMRK